jgi:hypothetical protein
MEDDILGFDPAHWRSELISEKLDEEDMGEFLYIVSTRQGTMEPVRSRRALESFLPLLTSKNNVLQRFWQLSGPRSTDQDQDGDFKFEVRFVSFLSPHTQK